MNNRPTVRPRERQHKVEVVENLNECVALKLHCGLKKMATRLCIGGNYFLSEATV